MNFTFIPDDDVSVAESSKSLSDYTQIILFTLFVVVGLPMNLSTFVYMMRRYRHAKSFLLLLHINLNVTDILVLGPSTIGTLIWNLTGVWHGGNMMCKFMRFVDLFAFMASSNIMVCIALYRLYALRYPLWVSAVGHSRVPRLLLTAWGLAIICASPQLAVWREYEMPDGSTHCVNYWVAKTHEENRHEYLPEDAFQVTIYNIAQVILMFYIPCIILVVCYVLILKDIYATLTLNDEADTSSVLYIAEFTRLSSCIALRPRSLRGQDRFQRAKIRSLRITLLLILCYIITWMPYNMLSWLMVYDLPFYMNIESTFYFLNYLVYLNSVINPFIYGRCEGLKQLFCCMSKGKKKSGGRFC